MSDRKNLNRAVSVARGYDPYTSEWLEHEFESYALLREHLPVARTEQLAYRRQFNGGWLLTRYDDISACLSDTDVFSSQSSDYPQRPWIPQAIDPPSHTAYRRIMNKWFTPEAMTAMEPHLWDFAGELLDKMLQKDEFDFVADFADPFPTVIFCELFGFPLDDYEQLMDWKNTLMHATDGHSAGRALAVAKAKELGLQTPDEGELPSEVAGQVYGATAAALYEYFGGLLEQRREHARNDMISQLIASEYDGERPLTNEELLDTLFLMFMAGLDTVASAMGLIVKTFAEQPDKRREFIALMDDSQKLTLAVEELVRTHAIVLLPRRVTEEKEFEGASMHAGDQVMCPTMAGNRDPEQFENPDEIIYDRVPNRHMGFGHGPHRCLGIHLARRELRIGLQLLHQRMPDYELHPDKKPELFGGMKGASSLWLRKG
tara:strand:- start:2461 stop:3753 length:1293 start_codon:yes stop_codon:yes gene_type:complete